jgi:hypothetical protein
MLLELRQFIRREGMVSIQQLTRAFRIEESALRPMLEFWVKKGDLLPYQKTQGCQSACGAKCMTSAVVFYVSQN